MSTIPGERFAPRFAVLVNGVGLHAAATAAVTDLSVKCQPDMIDHCSLTIANPLPTMRWTHVPRDADVFREGNGLTVLLGYDADLQLVFDGEITAVSPSFPESGAPTLKIEGYTRMHRLAGSPKTRTFVDMTDRQIAARVARDMNMDLDADDPGVSHPYVIQYNQTDLAFLLERANRIRYEVAVDGRKLRFKRGGEAAPRTLTLVYAAASAAALQGGGPAHPLLHFSPTLNLLRPVDHVIVRGQHPKTRAPIEARAGAGDADATLGGDVKGATVSTGVLGVREHTVVNRPVASLTEAKELARALFTKRALQFVTGSGASVGLPEMTAGQVVRLLGLGRFCGNYYVTECTHAIGASGYQTAFSVRTDSLS